MRIYNFPRRLFYESGVSFIGISFSLPWFVEAKSRIGFILTGIIILMGFILFEIFAIIKYFRDISVINEEKIVQMVNKKIVKEMRQEDIRRIIILYNPKGKITKIIIDDGSYQQEKSFYHQSGEEKSKFTFCFFDYTKAREKYIEKCWPDMPIEKVASYGDVT